MRETLKTESEPGREAGAPGTLWRRGIGVRRRLTPEVLPLWGEVKELEEALRPAAAAVQVAARRVPAAGVLLAQMGAVLFGLVVWAVEVQRLGVVAARSARQGGLGAESVPPLWSYLTVERIALAWQAIAGAVAVGAILVFALLVLPPTRRFARRHPIVPFFAGGAIWIGALQTLQLLGVLR